MASGPAEVGASANRYQILAKLAVGGMAEIFLARGASGVGVERHCVLKRILREHAGDDDLVRMFLDEARLAAQLQHPNIAQVFDIGMLGDSYFFTMEYVHGETVRELLHRAHQHSRPLPIACVLTIIAGTAAGLHHAHVRTGDDGRPLAIVHRDVSPSNLMVSYEGNVKLVDFGVAKADNRAVETRSGTVKGKISYLSPEQCRGERVDRRSDLFSLGIVMWEMLTGARLYRRASDFENMTAIVHEPPQPPSARRPEIARAVDAIALRLLAKSPSQRFQTAAEVVEAIEHAALAAGALLSTSAVGRVMRELFGERALPWLEDGETRPYDPVSVESRPITPVVGPRTDELEAELVALLAAVPKLPASGIADPAAPADTTDPSPGDSAGSTARTGPPVPAASDGSVIRPGMPSASFVLDNADAPGPAARVAAAASALAVTPVLTISPPAAPVAPPPLPRAPTASPVATTAVDGNSPMYGLPRVATSDPHAITLLAPGAPPPVPGSGPRALVTTTKFAGLVPPPGWHDRDGTGSAAAIGHATARPIPLPRRGGRARSRRGARWLTWPLLAVAIIATTLGGIAAWLAMRATHTAELPVAPAPPPSAVPTEPAMQTASIPEPADAARAAAVTVTPDAAPADAERPASTEATGPATHTIPTTPATAKAPRHPPPPHAEEPAAPPPAKTDLIARYNDGQYQSVVARCRGTKLSAEIARPCLLAACQVHDAAEQTRWMPIADADDPTHKVAARCKALAAK